MKKSDIILLIVVVAIFLLSAFVINVENKDKKSQKEMLTKLSYENYEEKISSGDKFVVVIERTGCSYCEKYMPIVKKVAKEYNTSIYYIDTDTLSSDELNKLSSSNDYLSNNEWGTPTTLYLEGQTTIDSIGGYVEKSTLVEFLKNNGIVD